MGMPYAIAGTLPQTWTLVDAAYDLLVADADLIAAVQSADNIHKNAFPETFPQQGNRPFHRLRVSVPPNPYGRLANVLGRRSIPLRIVVQANNFIPASGYDPRRALAIIHEIVIGLLNGTKLTLSVGELALALFLETYPGDAELLPNTNILVSGATYRAIIDPVTP